MIGPSGNVKVYLACGVTDMRRGIDGLATLAREVIKEDPGSGAIFGFRGKRAKYTTFCIQFTASDGGLPMASPVRPSVPGFAE